MKKTTVLVIALLFTAFTLTAQVFNNKLTSDEQQRLANGELIIRNIGKAKNISINGVNATLSKTVDTIKELNGILEEYEPTTEFDNDLFEQIVQSITVNDNTQITFRLLGNIELTEEINEKGRCKSA